MIALLFVPLERVNVAQLLPIRAVAVYAEDGVVVLETDTKHLGRGETAEKALENLKVNTPNVVYLDTAEYLMVSNDTVNCVQELRDYLKPSVKVCVCDAAGRVEYAAEYLEIHGNLTKLKDFTP